MRLLDGINDTEDELYTFDSIMEIGVKNKGLEALKNIKINCCTFEDKTLYQTEFAIIEKELKALEIIKTILFSKLKVLNVIRQNFKLVGNCLHAKNKYTESGWVFVKELEDEEEHNAWKEVFK